MRFRLLFGGAVALAAISVLTAPANAQLLADITGGSVQPAGAEVTAGYVFTVGNEIPYTLDALGFWDEGSDGLVNPHDIGLFLLDGTPLRTATVDNASTPLASTEAGGRWLFSSVAPIVLQNDTYVLLATFESGADDQARVNPGFSSTAPGTTIVGNVLEAGGPGLIFTTQSFTSTVFGPNLYFFGNGAAGAPEPGTLALLSVAGLGLLAMRRRK